MRPITAAAMTLAALSLLPLSGCGSAPVQGAATAPVKGKVLYKGQPLTKGTVTFEPDSGGREAFGDIQTDGTFVLTTYKKDDGAVIGNHRVSVSNAGKTVPAKYAGFQSSKIEVEVSEGKTDYLIDLK